MDVRRHVRRADDGEHFPIFPEPIARDGNLGIALGERSRGRGAPADPKSGHQLSRILGNLRDVDRDAVEHGSAPAGTTPLPTRSSAGPLSATGSPGSPSIDPGPSSRARTESGSPPRARERPPKHDADPRVFLGIDPREDRPRVELPRPASARSTQARIIGEASFASLGASTQLAPPRSRARGRSPTMGRRAARRLSQRYGRAGGAPRRAAPRCRPRP